MSPLTEPTRIVLRNGWQPMDPDAATYITAVESADGQALEEPVKIAIDNFVLGCKADGVWDAIKASCILAGARTLDGALVPLVGAAPTNYNFVSGDYNRKTGLVGNGSSKRLNTQYLDSTQPRTNRHRAVYATSKSAKVAFEQSYYIANQHVGGSMYIGGDSTNSIRLRTPDSGVAVVISRHEAGLIAFNRTSDVNFEYRNGGVTTLHQPDSITGPNATPIYIFSDGIGRFSDPRLAFYSIGESLDLALLDARVTDLINKFAEVIP